MAKVVKKGKVSKTTAKKSRLSKSVAKKSRFGRTVARKEKFSELKGKKIYKSTNDTIFKRIFGDIKNKNIIKNFLCSVLKLPEDEFSVLKIGNPFLNSQRIEEKVGILDVKILTKNNLRVDVEIQVAETKSMEKRVVWYLSKMISDQLKKGEDYDKIKNAVCILIAADHIIVKENVQRFNHYLMRNDENDSIFTDIIEIDVLDLKKKPVENENPQISKWIDFFNADSLEKLEILSKSDDLAVQEAADMVLSLNATEAVRIEAEQRENALRLIRTEKKLNIEEGIEIGHEQGLAEGEKKGKQEEKIEIAKKMKSRGMSTKDISEITGLTADEIENL